MHVLSRLVYIQISDLYEVLNIAEYLVAAVCDCCECWADSRIT